jgi:stress-induced morphogen
MTEQFISDRLKQKFPESQIEVKDYTGTGDHFEVSVVSESFRNLSRIKRHQLVMSVFPDELKSGELHALVLKTKTPDEG